MSDIYFKYHDFSDQELISMILKRDKYSDEVAFYLIRHRMLDDFRAIYYRYNLSDELGDVLQDFFMYLREGKNHKDHMHYSGLENIKSDGSVKSWLHSTFSNFMFDKNTKEQRRIESNKTFHFNDYQSVNHQDREERIMQISLMIAWVAQDSDADQRFHLFRHLMHTLCKGELIDNYRMAEALGQTYGTYRVRDSRLDARMHKYLGKIQRKENLELDATHSELARTIFDEFGSLSDILKKLYEENLPKTSHWKLIQELRTKDMEERDSGEVKFSLHIPTFEDYIGKPPVKPDFRDLNPRANTLKAFMEETL